VNYFYNDVEDEEEKKKLFASLSQHSQKAFETPVSSSANDLVIDRTYIVCENDQAVPLFVQEMYIAADPGMKMVRMNSGHSPFITQLDRLVGIIKKASGMSE
jgi:hypothetical protein